MDPLHLCIAMGPLSVYLMLIGWINLSSRPFVTSGTRDLIALAIALSGLVVAGPLELFMPETAAVYFQAWIWPPLISLYLLCATLVAMLMRPRIVVYNVTAEQLYPVLESAAAELGPERRWVGHSLVMPQLGVHLNLEQFGPMRNVQLVSVGGRQDLVAWRRLELELRKGLRDLKVGINPRGFSLLFFGMIMAVLMVYSIVSQPEEIIASLSDFLRR